jgi:hypothetical protein
MKILVETKMMQVRIGGLISSILSKDNLMEFTKSKYEVVMLQKV